MDSVEPGSIVSTHELYSYGLLTGGRYKPGQVTHSEKEWSRYDYRTGAWHSTNGVESFWKLFKTSIRETHVQISSKYMQRYLSEFTCRANYREMVNGMFDLLISVV